MTQHSHDDGAGPKPPKPMVSAAMSGNTITVACTEGGESVSFSCNVSLPNSGVSQMGEPTAFVTHFLLGKDPPTLVDKTTRGKPRFFFAS